MLYFLLTTTRKTKNFFRYFVPAVNYRNVFFNVFSTVLALWPVGQPLAITGERDRNVFLQRIREGPINH